MIQALCSESTAIPIGHPSAGFPATFALSSSIAPCSAQRELLILANTLPFS
jgi:hypothetical protein